MRKGPLSGALLGSRPRPARAQLSVGSSVSEIELMQ